MLYTILDGLCHAARLCTVGKVRKECVEGLKRVIGLRRVEWARQVGSMNLLPSCAMLTLLDKKFGGELTKEDVQVNSCCSLQVSMTWMLYLMRHQSCAHDFCMRMPTLAAYCDSVNHADLASCR